MATQKVVIPKGLVNPNETTIVEIPKSFQNVGTVVARPRRSASPGRPGSGVGPTTYRKGAEKNKSLPKAKLYGKFKMLHDGGTSFGGMQNWYDESSAASSSGARSPSPQRQASMSPYHPPYRAPTSFVLPQDRDISDADISYRGFRDIVHPVNSTMREIDDMMETIPYKAFRPTKGMSSHPNTPQRSPQSMRRYLPSDSSELEQSYSQDVSSRGNSQQIREERSFADYSQDYSGSGECHCVSDLPSEDETGGYEGDVSAGSPKQQLTQSQVLSSLGEIESTELNQIMADLSSFQRSRRQLIFDASSLSGPGDIAKNFISKTT